MRCIIIIIILWSYCIGNIYLFDTSAVFWDFPIAVASYGGEKQH